MTPGVRNEAAVILEGRDLVVVLGGQKVLDVPEFSVRRGEVMMLIGPNGSGKTTLLLTLALLLNPASGSVLYHGRPIAGREPVLYQRRKLAVVFQEALLLNSSVMDNVTLGMKLRGVPRHEVKDRAEKWLDRFGILSLAKRQARLLSGGEAKRTSLARAFALEPEVLFLDEPFMALDTPTRQGLLEDFESVLRETETTVLMVTHDRDEAMTLGDRVAVVMAGEVRQTGAADDIFCTPVDEEVAAFVEAGNILRGVMAVPKPGLAFIELDGHRVRVVSDLPAGSRVTGYLQYDEVNLASPQASPEPSDGQNRLSGTITRTVAIGSQVKVYLDCGFPLVSLISKRSWEELGLEIGKQVGAVFQGDAVHLIPRHESEE